MKVDIEQRTPAWYAFRKGKIGSSGAPTIMDCNRFQNKYDLWHELNGLTMPKEDNEAMRTGRELEDDARLWAEQELGMKFSPACYEYEEGHYLIASLDGVSECGTCLIEIKCSEYYYNEAKKGNIPTYVYAQMQHQFLVSGIVQGYFVAYWGFDGVCIKVYAAPNFIVEYKEKARDFNLSLALKQCPYTDAKRQYERVDLSHDDVEKVRLWKELSDKLADLKYREDDARKEVLDLGDDGDLELCYEGIPLVQMTRVTRDGNVDWKKLCKDKGISDDEIAKYRKQEIGYYKLVAL